MYLKKSFTEEKRLKADNVSLLEFIGASKRTFYIPVYQRNYDWKKIQCMT